MKRILVWIPALILAFGTFWACSEDSDPAIVQGKTNKQVTFKLNLSDMISRDVTNDEVTEETIPDCGDYDLTDLSFLTGTDYCARVEITIEGNANSPFTEDLSLKLDENGNLVTTPIMLAVPEGANNPQLESLMIVDKSGEEEAILFSAVLNGSELSSHVNPESLLPIELSFDEETGNLAPFEKKTIDITLLCAVNIDSDDFGFAIWALNFTKVICIDYTVNVPSDPCAETSSDVVGTTTITLTKQIKVDGVWKDTLTHVGTTSESGVKGTICFNDQGAIADEDEQYNLSMEITFNSGETATVTGTMSLAQMLGYECSGYWQVPYGGTNGILHFNFADVDFTTAGAITPGTIDASCTTTAWELSVTEAVECENGGVIAFKK